MKDRKKTPICKYIWKMMMYRPWYYLFNCILWVIIHAFPLIPGLITKRFFDLLESTQKINGDSLSLMAMLIAVALTRSIIIIIGGKVDSTHRFTMSALLRRNMLESIISNPALQNKTSLGETMNCLRDDIGGIEDLISFTLDITGDAVFAIGAFIIMLNINVRITLWIFIPLVAVIILSKKVMKYIGEYRMKSRAVTGDASGAMGEVFNGIQAIKVSGNHRFILDNINKANNNRMKYMIQDKVFCDVMDSVYEIAISIGTGLILFLSSRYILEGSFSVGDFSLFVCYLAYVADFSGFLGEIFGRYEQGRVAFQRMFMLLGEDMEEKLLAHNKIYLKGNLPKEETKELKVEFKKLEVEDLTLMYNDLKGIKNVDLTLNKGEFVVVTGRVGSGKTTLVKAMLGMIPVDSGKIYLNGEEVKEEYDKVFVPPLVAYTSQNPNLFSDTIKNNILLGLKDDPKNLQESIYSAVLERDVKGFKDGLDTVVGSKGVKLSGGQKQRVAVARMFARKAKLYILDDISSALDVETEIKLWDRMFKKKDMTALVVSNKHMALKNADKIIVMKSGKVEATGKLNELLETSEEMRQIWGMETN